MTQTPADALPAVNELRLIGGDELVREMMTTFVRFAESQLPRLGDAVRSGQLSDSALIAHTLKSSAGQMGAIDLSDACAVLELAARGGDAAGVSRGFEQVSRAFAAARPWLSALGTV